MSDGVWSQLQQIQAVADTDTDSNTHAYPRENDVNIAGQDLADAAPVAAHHDGRRGESEMAGAQRFAQSDKFHDALRTSLADTVATLDDALRTSFADAIATQYNRQRAESEIAGV